MTIKQIEKKVDAAYAKFKKVVTGAKVTAVRINDAIVALHSSIGGLPFIDESK